MLWALTSPDIYSLLVVQSGWTGAGYEKWLVDTLTEQLFGGGDTARPAPTGS